MTTGRAIILHPTLLDSVKRRQRILDSLRRSRLEYAEQIEETRIVITWQGQPKHVRPAPISRKVALPPPISLEKCLKSRCNCQPDDTEYWDEMIALSAEREATQVNRIRVRTKWESYQWAETWAVRVSEHLAVNRGNGLWTVTHVPTGLAAGSASSLKDAVRIAHEVAHWPEWAFLQVKDDITPEFRRKADEAFKAVAA
jgi:hypothetical protein